MKVSVAPAASARTTLRVDHPGGPDACGWAVPLPMAVRVQDDGGGRRPSTSPADRAGSHVTSARQLVPGSSGWPLVAVKAQVPPLRSGLVARQRLVRRLRGDGSGRLTVVVSPAGGGGK